MMDKKIFVVDDEKLIVDILEFNLRKEGYEVYCVYDGNEVVEMVEEFQFDLIFLDIMFFNKDGVEVCCEVRKKYDMLIIMLMVKDLEIDKVIGFEIGVDDYVIKLFSICEFLVCVKVNLCCQLIIVFVEEELFFNEIYIGFFVIFFDVYVVLK